MPELCVAYVQCDVNLADTLLQYKATYAQLVAFCMGILLVSAAYTHVQL